jgi:hypothetical protein
VQELGYCAMSVQRVTVYGRSDEPMPNATALEDLYVSARQRCGTTAELPHSDRAERAGLGGDGSGERRGSADELRHPDQAERAGQEGDGSFIAPRPSRWRQSVLFVPVVYDMVRRVELMRAVKLHVNRRGFGKAVQDLHALSADDILACIHAAGSGADLRTLMTSTQVPATVREAAKAMIVSTGRVLGSEGHRTEIRHRLNALSLHFGHAHVFVTPNLSDSRCPLFVALHGGPGAGGERGWEAWDLDWTSEAPAMPGSLQMLEALAQDCVAQAQLFDTMMELFFRVVLGVDAVLRREYGQAFEVRLHEDSYAASVLGGCFGDVACAMGPIETQGRGSLHPHTLVVLLGHDAHARLRQVLTCQDGRVAAEQLRSWGRLVCEAACRIQYECQEMVASDLRCPPVPLPLSKRQRQLAGAAYEDAPLVAAERDVVADVDDDGPSADGWPTLTGCAAAVLPAYRRADSDLGADPWAQAFCSDHRRLVIHNHLHKCGSSCFKKQPVGPRGLSTCRFGCFHFETVEVPPTDAGPAISKRRRRAGWPPRTAAGFVSKADDTQSLYIENPYVGKLAPVRRHPFEGPSHPVPQVTLRSNVDVKYLGRALPEQDLDRLLEAATSSRASGSDEVRLEPSPAKRRRLTVGPGPGEADRKALRALREQLWEALAAVERDLKSTQHYVAEYATKKFQSARDLLPQLHKGLARLAVERKEAEEAGLSDGASIAQLTRQWAYRTLLRMCTSMQRCVAKSRCEMAYQLLFQRECFATHVPYVMYVGNPLHSARQERCADPNVDAPALDEAEAAVPILGVVEEAEVGDASRTELATDGLAPVAADAAEPGPGGAVGGDVGDDPDGGRPRKARRVARRVAFGEGTSQKDDFVHRGHLAPLAQMGLYVYSRCVRRLPKNQVASRATGCIYPFAEHYVMHADHVQELRLADVPVQPAGLYVPPCAQRREENALVRLILFSPRPCCEGASSGAPCAGTAHWRLHGPRGFTPELRRHVARRQVLVARAQPRLDACGGGTATHDVWSVRPWHPANGSPEETALLLARSWRVRATLLVACLRVSAGRSFPPRAWERVVWYLGADGLQPPPPLLAPATAVEDELHVGHHFEQLTAEEFVAVLEDRFDQQLDLQVAARTARQGTRTLRPDLQDAEDDDLGCADADHGAVVIEIEEALPGGADRDVDESGEYTPGFPLVPAEVVRVALRETQWQAAAKPVVGRPAAGSIRRGLTALRTILAPGLDQFSTTVPVLSGTVYTGTGGGARASGAVKTVRLADGGSASRAQTAVACALLPDGEECAKGEDDLDPALADLVRQAAAREEQLPVFVSGTLPGQESPAQYGWHLAEKAKLNETQLRAVAPVVLAVHRLWQGRSRDESDTADGPVEKQLVCLWLGAGGSGKTWAYTQVLRPLFVRFFGPRGVLAMAPTHPAAMLLGRGALTMHRAAGADFHQAWDPARLSIEGQTKKRLRELWDPVRAMVLDEVSLARPDVYYGTSVRAMYARQRTQHLDANAHGQQPFGHVPVLIHIGDFLQMRPPGRRSLCEVQAQEGGEKDEDECQEEDGSTADELGRLLFRDNLTHVVQFTGTGRFQDTPSGRQLVAVLDCMRSGKPMSDELWAALSARAVDETCADPRLAEPRFAEGHEGATRWEFVARLQHLRAVRESRQADRRLWYVQAIDTPTEPGVDWTRATALEALEVVSMVASGYLMGLCPLYVGMHVRLTGNLAKAVLVRELRGHVEELWLHPNEPAEAREDAPGLPPVLLKYMPTGVLVRLEDPSLADVRFAPGLPPGRILVPPLVASWEFSRQVSVQGRRPQKTKTRLRRRQVPLAPAAVNTQYGLQGQTARRGMTAYLYTETSLAEPIAVPPKKPVPNRLQQDYWLAVYVLLSRPTQLDDLLIVGLPPRHLFQWGPPPGIAARLADFDALALKGGQLADKALAALDWPASTGGREEPTPAADDGDMRGEPSQSACQVAARPVVLPLASMAGEPCPRVSAVQHRASVPGPSSATAGSSRADGAGSVRSDAAATVAAYLRTAHFDRQEGAHCGLHALNNVVGERIFTRGSMLNAVRAIRTEDVFMQDRVFDPVAAAALEPVLAAEALARLGIADEDVQAHASQAPGGFEDVNADGNYSSEVLAKALEAWGRALQHVERERACVSVHCRAPPCSPRFPSRFLHPYAHAASHGWVVARTRRRPRSSTPWCSIPSRMPRWTS